MAAKDYQYRIYGQATRVYFSSLNNAGTGVWAGGFGAGESQISKDAAAFANTTNLPVYIANGVYRIDLTAAEMQADVIQLSFIDSGPGNIPDWVEIATKLAVGHVEIDASSMVTGNIALEIHSANDTSAAEITTIGNATGLILEGAGTGPGLLALGGATGSGVITRGGATSGAGFFSQAQGGNSVGFATTGFGTGQGFIATGGSDGSGLAAVGNGNGIGFNGVSGGVFPYPTNFFDEPLEDITGPPAPGVTLRQGIAALVARMFYLVTQTTTQQKQYKSDSATLVGTAPVSDDGVTQIKGRSV